MPMRDLKSMQHRHPEMTPRMAITKSIGRLKTDAIYANYYVIHKRMDVNNKRRRIFFRKAVERCERARLTIACQMPIKCV